MKLGNGKRTKADTSCNDESAAEQAATVEGTNQFGSSLSGSPYGNATLYRKAGVDAVGVSQVIAMRLPLSCNPRYGAIAAMAAIIGLASMACVAAEQHATSSTEMTKHDAAATALPAYSTLDANQNGIVTLPEVVVFSPALAHRIAHCDRDGDKVLSREEYAACHPRHAGKTGAGATASPAR